MSNFKETTKVELGTQNLPAVKMRKIKVMSAVKGVKGITFELPENAIKAELSRAMNAAGTIVNGNINIQVLGTNYKTEGKNFESLNVMLTQANGYDDNTQIPSGNLAISTQQATSKGRSEYSEAKAKVKALYSVKENKSRIKEICKSHGKGNYTHCGLDILNEIIAEFSAESPNVADVAQAVQETKSVKKVAKVEVSKASVDSNKEQLDRIESLLEETLAMTISNSSAIAHLKKK